MGSSPMKSKLIKSTSGDWEVVIGMEVHAQVTSRSKLFSGASTAFGGEPNSHVSLVDAAMPGMLPVINEECIKQAVRTGLGLKARINLKSVFDRKNYFYPDLPPGYQISQYKSPLVGEGEVIVDLPDGETVTVGIERLHLEQDAGKSLHDRHSSMSFVDLNRAGVALMEIVSKPDLRSSEEAMAYVAKLRSILRYLGTCDGDMEKGNLRADVNVSVRKPGAPLGTRCEIKNLNSIRFIGQAIEHEARRQIDILEEGGEIEQETRLFDANEGETRAMRSKEEAHDYRYFPDPDLLPLELSPGFVEDLRAELPALPDERKAHFISELGMNSYNASVLVSDKSAADFFEATLANLAPFPMGKPRTAGEVAKWVMGDLFGRLNKAGLEIENSPVTPSQMAELIGLQFEGVVSGTLAKQVLDYMWANGGRPRAIVERLGLKQVTDTAEIEKVIDDVVAKNPDNVEQVKTNPNVVGWFVGQVMKATGGKANPQTVNKLLRARLFEDGERTRQEPLRRGERLIDFYDEAGRNGYDEFRSILNGWLLEIDEVDRSELISRMRHGSNGAFRAAVCELLMHALLLKLGHKIIIHPEVSGSKKHPDFALIDENDEVLCYVEVTTVNRANAEEGELNREAAIYNAIDRASLPAGCLLSYELIRAGSKSPPLGPLVASIEHWAKKNASHLSANEAVERFTAGEWVIELELFSSGDLADATGIGVVAMRGGVIAPHRDIRAALEGKSRAYVTMDASYLIAVADTKDQLFNEEHIKNAITEAVFGDERIVFVDGNVTRDHARNGLWIGPDGLRNRHVSAVLLLPKAGIWELRQKRWQPLLAINPWAKFPIPDTIKGLTRLEADGGKWVLHDGKLFADILGLPTPWPPIG
jgi:aspartyl-tRNA(Asn)/glutamyl-tRNA(Gln) amidotransferase subunit B